MPEDSDLIGKPTRELVVLADGDISVVALIRRDEKELAPPWYTRIQPSDHLMIEGGTEAIAMAVEKSGFDLATDRDISKESVASDEVIVVEAVVNPGSRLEGRTTGGLRINSRYGVNILTVARQGKPIRDRIGQRFAAGNFHGRDRCRRVWPCPNRRRLHRRRRGSGRDPLVPAAGNV